MTNNKQQTAVGWLQSIELERDLTLADWKQAKEMEKKQIIHSYNQSWHFRDKPYETAEKYYEQTYGGAEQ
jgi:hypothetical protein